MFGTGDVIDQERRADSVSLGQLRAAVLDYAAGFDADLLSTCDAETVVGHATAMINSLEFVRARAACRVADGGAWKRDGDPSPAHHYARNTGQSIGGARKALQTGERTESMPELEDALRKGELSPDQAAPIADAVAADPSAESDLIDAARRKPLKRLLDDCEATKANADPDPDATHERIRRSRYVRSHNTADGAAEMHCRGTRDAIAAMMSIIRGRASPFFDRARIEGRRESEEAYLFDGLEDALRASVSPSTGATSSGTRADAKATGEDEPDAREGQPTSPAPRKRLVRNPTPTKVIVRIDWTALVRGFTVKGETCEIAGVGPVPVSVVKAMVESGDAFLAALLTKGTDIASVVHLGRKPTALQETALEWLNPKCTNEACPNAARLEKDHREDWADTKVTRLAALDRPCEHCHDLKTQKKWAFVEGTGERAFVPPEDPRHPRHRRPPPT